MNTVYNKEEARDWFLENHTGRVTCLRDDGEILYAKTYKEAADFFDTDTEEE